MPSLQTRSQKLKPVTKVTILPDTSSPHHLIPPDWLARPSQEVAPELLGCVLARRMPDGRILRGTIVEVEAYTQSDPACHGHRGKTERNKTMFGPAGNAYVYFIYGVHHCLNIVTGLEGIADGVLIRAVHYEVDGPSASRVAAGPGKLCSYLNLNLSHCGSAYRPDSGLWLEFGKPLTAEIVQTRRIGLTKGADSPWRWYVKGNPAVSRP